LSKLEEFLDEVRLYEHPGYAGSPPEHSEYTRVLRRMVDTTAEIHRQSVRKRDDGFHDSCPGICYLQAMEDLI